MIHKETMGAALDRAKSLVSSAGWSTGSVEDAVEILDELLSPDTARGRSSVVSSRTEILRHWRYLDYWYFEGAPLSVQVALYVALRLNLMNPPHERKDRIAEFIEYFENQCAFKAALNTSETVGGWLFPGEPELLWEAVRRTSSLAGNLCEIGSWTGRSTILLAAACQHASPAKSLHVVDDWRFGDKPNLYPYLTEGRRLKAEFEHNLRPWRDRIRIHEGNFRRIHTNLGKACPDGLSLVFHDAGHSPEDFERDLSLIAPLINKDGLLLIHDYVSKNFQAGRTAIDQWLASRPEFVLEKVVGSCAQIRKS